MTSRLRGYPVFFYLLLALMLTLAAAQTSNRGVWLVPIEGVITPATAQFVSSSIERANEAQPLALVFLIDTPGGRVDAAEDIVDAILREAQLPTIAVVESALSAGAIIAMSAEQLAMLPGSEIGAATVINALTGQQASEKINSAWRGMFRSVASARGRNTEVAEGMVDKSVVVPGISTAEELITLTGAQAVEYNIADLQASSLQDALAQLGYADVPIERLEPSLTQRVAGYLTMPLVAALLLAVGIGGILIEIFTPGFGVPGALGVVALALYFGGAFIATPASVFDLVLILGGVLLLAAEVLVIPGFGVAGILGLGAIIFSTVRVFQGNSVFVLGYATLFGSVLLGLAFWLLPNTRFGHILMLSDRLESGSRPTEPSNETAAGLSALAGQQGVAASDLRPAGVARFGSQRVDVVTEGDYVDSGAQIQVLRVEGNRVTVRVIEPVEAET